jgi:hypothetical protein
MPQPDGHHRVVDPIRSQQRARRLAALRLDDGPEAIRKRRLDPLDAYLIAMKEDDDGNEQ